jgi:hypothetical protein
MPVENLIPRVLSMVCLSHDFRGTLRDRECPYQP